MKEGKFISVLIPTFMVVLFIALLYPVGVDATKLELPPVTIDPIVNRSDGQVTFATEWSGAHWVVDYSPLDGTYYGESKENWNAISSMGNQATYPLVTAFVLHDIWELTQRNDYDYNTFCIVGIDGTKITTWVFDDLDCRNDRRWLGGSGLTGPQYSAGVDDRGYIVRKNDDPTTDVHWFPGMAEPGDPGWSWPPWYGFFGTYGFNNTPYTQGLAGSQTVSDPREIYEVAFRDPTETGSAGFQPGVSLYLAICDVAGDDPSSRANAMRMKGSNTVQNPDPYRYVLMTAEEMGMNVTFGDTSNLPINFRNVTGTSHTTTYTAYDSKSWGVSPPSGSLVLAGETDQTINFEIVIPDDSTQVGARDTLWVISDEDTCYSWFEVADELATVQITPDSALIHPDSIVFFGATGYDSQGRILHIELETDWYLEQLFGDYEDWPWDHLPTYVPIVSLHALAQSQGFLIAQLPGLVFGAAYIVICPDVATNLVPYNPPITIPAMGGMAEFNISVINDDPNMATFDIWTEVVLPNGIAFGPLIGPITITVPPGVMIERDRFQMVPAGAPSGAYTYYSYVGVYPDTVWHEASFDFEKLPFGDGQPVEEWTCGGESFEAYLAQPESIVPEEYNFSAAYPNPFNPAAMLSFTLPEASQVKLSIYDIQGRLVAILVDELRDAGTHEITFDATNLPSGVYIARMEANDFHRTQKLVMIK
ncbi:hypothetical protein CEE37_02610 [candidate division LCP-89 bacterium B3_LCP]|uniref:Secretion system C-terminal sorting domain-containing protein n=1 Tax=candidate division LCP-89 bacterium B3_LCP TaxID=2012998 RepID=A0A532V2M2_UNCL8|nr:MAG: hypothetical protein CEE37_02610 [candidate division LCP-89 bacterium B3_LCP]